jgi:UDP-N-acetylglucosamine 2-epimerase (non-hydrolysing)
MKIMSIIGTRPEAIKMAPVIKELRKHPDRCQTVVCTTAQHRQMLDQVFQVFDLTSDYDLNLMKPDQTLASFTARATRALDRVISRERPDWVLVQGDATSAMVASLVGFYHHVKIGHVEAGLRTRNRSQPFPEEINRRIIDLMSDLYFAPTPGSRSHLLNEGVASKAIFVTGNTGVDALMMTAVRVKQEAPVQQFEFGGKRLILVTAHRRENHGPPLMRICSALKEIAAAYRDDVHIAYPVHRNPMVYAAVHAMLDGISNITLLDPLDYEMLVRLLNRAYLVLTDSGGLQEEAPSFNKPVLILRDVTERVEVVDIGAAQLVGTESRTIVEATSRLLDDRAAYDKMTSFTNPYGDGRASERIVEILLNYDENSRASRIADVAAAEETPFGTGTTAGAVLLQD